MNKRFGAKLAFALTCGVIGGTAQAATVTFGSTASNNGFPFNIGSLGLSAQHYQQIYSAVPFGTAPVSISGLAFRVTQQVGYTGFGPSTLSGITIALGYSTTGYLTPGSTFSTNLSGATTVRSGALTLSSAGGPAYDIFIPISSFAYNPTLGDLVVDVVNSGGGVTTQFDFGDGLFSRLYTNADPNSATGTIQPNGLATQFTVNAVAPSVPEPATWAMMLMGFGAVGFGLRSRRNGKVATRVAFA